MYCLSGDSTALRTQCRTKIGEGEGEGDIAVVITITCYILLIDCLSTALVDICSAIMDMGPKRSSSCRCGYPFLTLGPGSLTMMADYMEINGNP